MPPDVMRNVLKTILQYYILTGPADPEQRWASAVANEMSRLHPKFTWLCCIGQKFNGALSTNNSFGHCTISNAFGFTIAVGAIDAGKTKANTNVVEAVLKNAIEKCPKGEDFAFNIAFKLKNDLDEAWNIIAEQSKQRYFLEFSHPEKIRNKILAHDSEGNEILAFIVDP